MENKLYQMGKDLDKLRNRNGKLEGEGRQNKSKIKGLKNDKSKLE